MPDCFYRRCRSLDIYQKLEILADSAKYDAACTSSGVDRAGKKGALGSARACGVCHSFTSDGRCVSLLKVLLTNHCAYDCQYCVNRRSSDVPRAAFTPRELADLTYQFYRRNYIEGLFLSSAVVGSPDHTTELMIEALGVLRGEYRFNGYIHAKGIPGTDPALLECLGALADRISVNIELPSQESLRRLAPDKSKAGILAPMRCIQQRIAENSTELVRYREAPKFAPAGQSTQMIIGATPESDRQILNLSEALYRKFALRRVFYSAYIPVSTSSLLPAITAKPPLLREHRLYQADWLLRFYDFRAAEILTEENPNFNPYLDPKCNYALLHPELFPMEINRAPYSQLLRIPGVGVMSARRIVQARRGQKLQFEHLKALGVVLKRAQYFITCGGKAIPGLRFQYDAVFKALLSERAALSAEAPPEQMSLFFDDRDWEGNVTKCLTGQM